MTTDTTNPVEVITGGRRAETPRGRRGSVNRNQKRAGWWFLAPALVHSFVFAVIPTIAVVVLSFSDYSFSGETAWVGFGNFTDLLKDGAFRAAFGNTVLYGIVVVPVAMVIALLVALGLNQKVRGIGFFRTAFYIPTVTASVAVGVVWLWIFNPGSGLANAVLSLFGIAPASWLVSPELALPSLMIIGIWQGIGAKMIIYLAALQGVPQQLVEAATIDGAGKWKVFWNVTWPSLGPAQFFVLITSIVSTFQVFDLVYVTTKGGPGTSTNVLVFDIYNNAFQALHLGYASAETVIMMLLIGAFLIVGRRLQGANNLD
ncbi:MAG: binding-protein-dependent transport system inner rane component [Micrococcaceae bacterium]|jgi:multiple sugar transport system permease protein|nr:binding-protein-dependent transport system inner rane component [Micrococcaceae bacterium]